MADSEDFGLVARALEQATSLSELQSRGLVRRLVKQAGFDSHDVTADQLAAIGRLLLHDALLKNGIAQAASASVVSQWLDCCAKQAKAADRTLVTNTVEEVFARMGLRR